jgi:hypothetical protein
MPGGRNKSMLHFFDPAFFLFSSSLFSYSKTTVNDNVEASGIAVICSFHQAVPGGLQVVVPVRNI